MLDASKNLISLVNLQAFMFFGKILGLVRLRGVVFVLQIFSYDIRSKR